MEALYAQWDTREAVGNDPVGFVHQFGDPIDQELAALIAASLAFGRVRQIHNSLRRLFALLGSPRNSLAAGVGAMCHRLSSFRHRFATGENVVGLLQAGLEAVARYGSLGACFRRHLRDNEDTTQAALGRFVDELRSMGDRPAGFLFSQPQLGGACKRWHLLLRWMVRADSIDVGLWRDVGAQRLVIPLDTHMYRIGTNLGFTNRQTADIKTALEITAGFRRLRSDDPVRYDFALARSAMESGGEVARLLER
jgi:uncharacterized protein (TIGR02757 family)